MPALPNPALVSLPADQPDWPPGFAAMAGWVEAGPILLRLDIAEKIAGELGYRAPRGPPALPSGLASRFAIKPDMLPAVLRQLWAFACCRRPVWPRISRDPRRRRC